MAFEPIHTDRLVLRPSVMADAPAAIERRSLPEVARYQDWELPYPEGRAEETMAKLEAMDGPVDGQGWSVTVVDRSAPEVIMGDLYVGVTWQGRSAEIGYTFHPDFWGRGYATEATQAMIRYLFTDFGVRRVYATLHPENAASARVLESCGMVFEGLTRQSFWVGEEISDDLLYGMPRPDWDSWCQRPLHRPADVRLVELSADNVDAVSALTTHWSQQRFVAPMLENFSVALAPPAPNGEPLEIWYRAIEADGEIAGFMMASRMNDPDRSPYLARLLVDRMQQRRGIGSIALDMFESVCARGGATAVEVSWAEGSGSPAPLYLQRGYVPTGRVEDGEIHAVKQLR